MEDVPAKVEAMHRISEVQADAGDDVTAAALRKEAENVARRTRGDVLALFGVLRRQLGILRGVKRQLAAKEVATALAIAQNMAESHFKQHAFDAIAIAQLEQGEIAEPLQTFQSLEDSAYSRDTILAEVAMAQATARNNVAALQTARSIDDMTGKVEVLHRIGQLQADLGDDATAAALRREADDVGRRTK